jgi:hypothetical protein
VRALRAPTCGYMIRRSEVRVLQGGQQRSRTEAPPEAFSMSHAGNKKQGINGSGSHQIEPCGLIAP